MNETIIAQGFTGTFGVVKLWPGMQVAEDEVIARLKFAAEKLGLQCVAITPDGKYTGKDAYVPREALDFVIHLHFETPKAYDFYSLVALWNPLEFYYVARPGIGYRLYSENIVTHDNFLSCGSEQADDHVRRQLVKMDRTDGPELTMYHSLAGPFFEPTLGEKKIFYVGINWERVGGKHSRHQDLLNLLDREGCVWIYGPEKVHNIRVWEGFKSYIGEIPFDGSSVIKRIAEAGIALVLSSEAHKDAELMSNRLFEALAAGAVVIADENAFARRHFDDTLLYIDTTLPTKKVVHDILEHLQWIKSHPEKALDMARRAQAIFKERYTMDRSIHAIYDMLEARRPSLLGVPNVLPVTLYFLLPEFDEEVVENHIASARAQDYPHVEVVMVIDRALPTMHKTNLAKAFERANCAIKLQEVDFYNPAVKGRKKPLPLGEVIHRLYEALPDGAFAGFVEPQERIFSDHLPSLVALLQANPESYCAYASMVLSRPRKGLDPLLTVHNHALLLGLNPDTPLGMGRFLIRKDASQKALAYVLPYLQVKPMAAFAITTASLNNYRVSVVRTLNDAPMDKEGLDNEILLDYMPSLRGTEGGATTQVQTDVLTPRLLSLHQLSRLNKLDIIKDLFDQLPVPLWFRKMVYYVYRCLNRHRR